MPRLNSSPIIFLALLPFVSLACAKEEDKKASVGAKLRTAGTTSGLGLRESAVKPLALTAGSMTANSSFTLESFKVPIYRINLVSGLSGTGYSGTSPDFYTCPGATDEECYVDLASSAAVDNLLKSNGEGSIVVDGTSAYEGAALEFCGTGGESGQTFKMKVKGTTTLNGVTYYTNATSALSTTSPAEEVEIPAACGGQTTFLNEPVSLGPDSTVNLVLYVEPAGAVLVSDNKSLVNSNCAGEESLAICASRPSVMVTVSDGKPSIERYVLEVDGTFDNLPWANMLLTTIFAAEGTSVGATVQQIFNDTKAVRLMHTLQYTFSKMAPNGDGYDLTYGGASSTTAWLSGFKRESGGPYTISSLVEQTVEVTATKL